MTLDFMNGTGYSMGWSRRDGNEQDMNNNHDDDDDDDGVDNQNGGYTGQGRRDRAFDGDEYDGTDPLRPAANSEHRHHHRHKNKNNNDDYDDDIDGDEGDGVLDDIIEEHDDMPSSPAGHSANTLMTAGSAMSTKVRQFRVKCGQFVNHNYVQLIIVFLIAINAAMMGIATFDFVSQDPYVSSIFETTDQVFLIIFTVELILQLIYRGPSLFLDGWLVFDFVIILVSWSFSSVQIIRAFRIFRALRLVTRIKVMKNLVLAVFGVMPRMAAIGLLLVLVFYIFAVMFTQLFKDLHKNGVTDEDYFSRLDWTLFTLFQIMTLDAWADIARQVIEEIKWAWLPFLIFVTISGFIVVNLIIAVICDAISALHEDEKAKIHGTYEEGDDSDSEDDTPPLDVQEQLETLEEQVDELTRIQAQTLHTLEYLTRHLQSRHGESDEDEIIARGLK